LIKLLGFEIEAVNEKNNALFIVCIPHGLLDLTTMDEGPQLQT